MLGHLRHRLRDRRYAIATATVTAVVAGSAVAIGGVHTVTILVLFTLAAAGAVAVLWVARPQEFRVGTFAPALGLAGLSAYSLLQALPMPLSFLRHLAPRNADVWERCLLPLGSGPRHWGSLSQDPGASCAEAAKWLTYAIVFALSCWTSQIHSAKRIACVVFGSAVFVAVATLVHGLFHAEAVFGLYVPAHSFAPWHIGPLLNPNNLAGYLNLGIFLGLGMVLSPRPPIPRAVISLGIATLVGEDIIAASRGGVAVLPLGVVALGLSLGRFRGARHRARLRSLIWMAGSALALGVMLAVLGTSRESWAELLDQNTLKFSMLLWSKPMIVDHWLFGVGRGAFESSFPAYRTYPGNVAFTHAENFPAQWLSEWGLPIGALATAAVVWFMRTTILPKRRRTLAAGIWCGAFVLFAQNLFDLALEVPAVCNALAAALGALWGHVHAGTRLSEPSDTRHRAGAYRALPAVGLVVLVLVLGLCAWRGSLHDLESDRELVHRVFIEHAHAERAADDDAVLLPIRASISRHPADPYFPLIAALDAWGRRDARMAMLGIERSLDRGLVNGRAHLLLAEILLVRSRATQALLELRLAVKDDSELVDRAAALAIRATDGNDRLIEIAPRGPAGIPFLEAAADRLPLGRQLELLEEASRRAPAEREPHQRIADRYLGALSQTRANGTCDGPARAGCLERARGHILTVERLLTDWSYGYAMEARLLDLQDRPSEGATLLAQRCADFRDRFDCMVLCAQLFDHAKNAREYAAHLRALTEIPCASAPECAGHATLLGDLFAEGNDWGAALTQYTKAANAATSGTAWAKVAGAAEHLGAHAEAAHALELAIRLSDVDAATVFRAELSEERQRAFTHHFAHVTGATSATGIEPSLEP